MLILTRCVGESVRIGDHIAITVVRIKGGSIQIGIAAPRELAVHREEIYARVKAGPEEVEVSRSYGQDPEAIAASRSRA